nr:FapA family protein [Halobacillus sp. A5]
MENIKEPKEIGKVTLSRDRMEAYFELSAGYEEVSRNLILETLHREGVGFGIHEETIHRLVSNRNSDRQSKEVVAVGKDPVEGIDGRIIFEVNYQPEVKVEGKNDFRDVINIPSVCEGEKLAVLKEPIAGAAGVNVLGEEVPARDGRESKVKAGKNVIYKDRAFYSEINGQLNYQNYRISVQPLYEVKGDVDLSTGNLDFIGSVIIRGNVPTGFKVAAGGDISVHGLVEGAELRAGGSIHISEGVSGLDKSLISAEGDIRAGYLNQANVEAGGDILVQYSILHSHCVAKQSVSCLTGNIIGGTISAGHSIEAKDAGNRMNTATSLSIGTNIQVERRKNKLIKQLADKQYELSKLVKIGRMLEVKMQKAGGLSVKERITHLRQRNSTQVIREQIEDLEGQLMHLESAIGDLNQSKIKVSGSLFGNVELAFGKYIRKTLRTYQHVIVRTEDFEVIIEDI